MTETPATPPDKVEPKPKEIPENKTQEKIVMEGRRMRGYLTAFKNRCKALEALEILARDLIAEKPLGFVGVDAYERRLSQWRERLASAIREVNRTRDALEAKTP